MPSPHTPADPPERWTPPTARRQEAEAEADLTILGAVRRGLVNRCPACGEGKVFQGFLRVVPECSACAAPLGSLRADDAPPYIVLFLTGHLLIPPIFWIEKAYEPPMWLHMVVWLPLFAIICTLLLRPVKGGVVGWMWKLGFAEPAQPRPDDTIKAPPNE